ncbi:hypothetical protein T05_12614 [Trichinella murrelli]|uniref:Uncharacterized protein n=1 Tax=Trichinella murrelli TaxID=144512 RepID=A0A0V0SPM0_9BILA|nr:hypothetical protein T05_12614 [Trichinella murrelli]
MDGTFKIVPQWYQQLFTIHAFVVGKLVMSVVYVRIPLSVISKQP